MPIRPAGSLIYVAGVPATVREVKYTFDVEFFERVEFSNEKLRAAKNVDGSKSIFIDLFGGKVVQFASTCNTYNTVRPIGPDDANVDDIKKRWDIRKYSLSGDVNNTGSVQTLQAYHQVHKTYLTRFQAHIQQSGMDLSYTALVALQAETFSYLTSTGLSIYGNPITPIGTLTATANSGTSALLTTVASEFVAGQTVLIGGSETKIIASIGVNTINLTTTLAGTFLAGTVVQLVETNMLVAEFTPSVDREYNTPTGPIVRKVWEATIENRVLKTARATS